MRLIRKLNFILSAQFGIDSIKFVRSLCGIPRYARDLVRFNSQYAGRLELLPCLHDWDEEGGTTKSEYFWQDLLVARMIFNAKPERHVDIGSRVDGFVAHVASFREVEVFDVRPITTKIPGVIFKQADFMNPRDRQSAYCDSLSCLHALEHFGLGRYGDEVASDGFERGFSNMAHLLKPGGTFYLSVPVGIDRVEFNAHRVLDPSAILGLAAKNALRLTSFIAIHPGGHVEMVQLNELRLIEFGSQRYALGMFVFVRI